MGQTSRREPRGTASTDPPEEPSDEGQRDASGSLSRRHFLEVAGGATVALSLPPLVGCSEETLQEASSPMAQPTAIPGPPEDFQAAYRRKWSWDGAVRGTHNINCAWQVACNFNVYTRSGVVVREEQVATYPQTHDRVPDFNPRGCQKGCSYSEMMYSAARVTHPLKRTGARGAGAWRAVSWDEALKGIADKMIDAMTQDGPDTVVLDTGTNTIGQTALAPMVRFADVIDSIVLDINTEIGDDQQGAAVTYGDWGGMRSGDDFFYSDLILIWGGNPVYTQIPDFHFVSEARYHGAQVVTITPDHSPSAIHADLWVPIQPGTDAALALSMAKVVIDEGLYDQALIREQTDLPFLVRLDNRKLLRESDLEEGGSEETLYRYDLARGRIEAPGVESLALNGSVPALEGVFEVETLAGQVEVQPVFELLRAELADYAPEKVSELCGVSPEMIRRLARMLAGAKAASNVVNTAISKFYHGDLMMRAQILIFLLCGHLGQKGAGYCSAGALFPDGQGPLRNDNQAFKEMRWSLLKKHGPKVARDYLTGKNMRRSITGLLGDAMTELRSTTNATLFWNLHGGVLEVSGRRWDPELTRDVSEYVREALDRNWQVLEPGLEKQPRVLISWAGNLLRRVRSAHRLQEDLWPKLDLIVAFELRMSSTAMYADYVLPVSGAYEKPSVTVLNTNAGNPFIHATNQAVEGVGEAKDEWEVVCLLVEKIQESARERQIETFTSRRGKKRRFDRVYDAMTQGGKLGEKDAEELCRLVVENSSNVGGVSWQELKEKGFSRFSGIGKEPFNFGQASDVPPHETITPYTWHTEKKEPWPTLSGRVQFYIDHDWYLDFGEQLPVHKPPPKAGGDYPLTMTGGHTRWSIHALQRTDPLLLRLQRGEPCMWIGVEDARARGIGDGDRIEVRNDVGSFITHAKMSPAVRPGQVIMYHAWENYQFEGGMGCRNVQASPLKPLELVGDYPYLKPIPAMRQPGQNSRDTRVDIRKL
jgi:DMSO reductase family type II enzyme molybdopterin subunit